MGLAYLFMEKPFQIVICCQKSARFCIFLQTRALGGAHMFRIHFRFVLVFFAALLTGTVASAETLTETSPDGQITLTVSDDGGMARYALSYRGEAVIAPSQLGLLFRDHHGFDSEIGRAHV